MKKSIDIIGLPIISISEGRELGKVKSFLINPTAGTVVALLIDDGKWYLGAKLLPFSAITGLGEYAVTLESSDSIVSVTATPGFEALLAADVKIIGTKVLTKVGHMQGVVREIIVDDTGKIIVCEVEETNGEIIQVPAQRVLTFGKEVLIVTAENDNTAVAASKTENIISQETTTEAASLISDEKHWKYLLGKKANRRVEADNGMIIVEQGGEITTEVLQKAKLAGKFVELSMNI